METIIKPLLRLTGYYDVAYPYPDRRLTGIISIKYPGKKFCRHRYAQSGYHEATTEPLSGQQPVRYSVRHYQCSKCGRIVFVDGYTDDWHISKLLKQN